MSLREQFNKLLKPDKIGRFLDTTLKITVIRFTAGQTVEVPTVLELGPFPSWFTLFEVKLALWDAVLVGGERDPAFAPQHVFLGEPVRDASGSVVHYKPIELVWKSFADDRGNSGVLALLNPLARMTGPPDDRFVDSTGGQKALTRDNRIRMTLNDVFQLSEGKAIPELHAFLYSDLVDRIQGPRPLGERDIYGRIVPYFPFIDLANLPSATDLTQSITPNLLKQVVQTTAALAQIKNLESQLPGIVLPELKGVKLMRWFWYNTPDNWDSVAVLFFGLQVTHERPFARFFPSVGQPLTKVRVKGKLPIPDLPDPNLLLSWKQDKNPESGKDSLYMKLRIQNDTGEHEEAPVFSTVRVFSDGTADLVIQPAKKTRVLEPLSDLQEAPEVIAGGLSDVPFLEVPPRLAQASVVFNLRIKREDTRVTKTNIKSRLLMFTSVFQEIPPLPEEQPLVMLRYKGVSNFTNESRVFAYLTQLTEKEMISGEMDETKWVARVSEEFQISTDEARKRVVAWVSQRGEFALAVSETKDYILNKNPGVDIAVFEQHPNYSFHIYSDQDSKVYSTIVNLLGLLISAPQSAFTAKPAIALAQTLSEATPAAEQSPSPEFVFHEDEEEAEVAASAAIASSAGQATADQPAGFYDDEGQGFMPGMFEHMAETQGPPEDTQQELAQEQEQAKEQDQLKEQVTFGKPTSESDIKVAKYYIDKLSQADPAIFNYKISKTDSDRGYVTHCAANETRQPIVLDDNEYKEMRDIYKDDKDIEFLVLPDDTEKYRTKAKRKQQTDQESKDGTLDGKPYPSEENKELIIIMKYGSKRSRILYYFCPRLFCIKDRLMVRYKDYISTQNRFAKDASPEKLKETCPFCAGGLITKDDKDAQRDLRKTILERKARPGADATKRADRPLYIRFLDRRPQLAPHYSLPCCFTSLDNTAMDFKREEDDEFIRLGLRSKKTQVPALVQPIADAAMGIKTQALATQVQALATQALATQAPVQADSVVDINPKRSSSIRYSYYSVIQGVSVKSIIDSNKLPLKIVEPKTADDPKAGPQIGLLPEALDKFFYQDSKSDKFAERLDIVTKLKPTAQGFMRVGIDNYNKEQSFLSAVAPFFWMPNAETLIDKVFEPLEARINPRRFLEINGGNLVHEFFKKCDKKNTNDMRSWVSKYLSIDELKSSNIPAIERLMNSYECFKDYIRDPTQNKDYRTFFDMLSEPGLAPHGIIFIVLEMSVEELNIRKGDKSEFKNEVKFENVRCPAYPLNETQQKADIGFLVHYNRITRERGTNKKIYSHIGWDPLFYVDGSQGTAESRHKPTLLFQRSQEASWPPIVQKRVAEFFTKCMNINRGPFTSEFGIDPYALISANELTTAMRFQPKGVIRDAYNHLVGVGYKIQGQAGSLSGIAAIPVSDDGSTSYNRNIFFDWDDFDPPPINKLIQFYSTQINSIFPQYKGYIPKSQIRLKDMKTISGLRLTNGFVIPAIDAQATDPVSEETYPIEEIDHLDWDINSTIAYDSEARRAAFKSADAGRIGVEEGEIKDTRDTKYMKLEDESAHDEIEDVYQHLRLTFSTWLATGAGSMKRKKLEGILKSAVMPLNYKRKQLDILLYSDIHGWLEPKEAGEKSDIGFLRIDCQIQAQADCKGRCKWAPKTTDNESCGPCKIHSPRTEGTIVNVPRMLYLRLVDELIRYSAKREEIFLRQVPRLTIRREAQRIGDQYIVPEGTSDWNTWWEILRNEWLTKDTSVAKFFDEQYSPLPTGLPLTDTRTMPASLKAALGADDAKVDELVWTPSTTPDRPFSFLKPVLRFNPITSKPESTLSMSELEEIKEAGNVQVLFMPMGILSSSIRVKKSGATDAIIIAVVDGVVGWVTKRGSFGVKIQLQDLPDSLNSFRFI